MRKLASFPLLKAPNSQEMAEVLCLF